MNILGLCSGQHSLSALASILYFSFVPSSIGAESTITILFKRVLSSQKAFCTSYVISVRFSGIYLTCTMAITTLSMVLTVFVLNLHHIQDRPVPQWMKRLLLVYLARVLCMYQKPEKSHRTRDYKTTKSNPFGCKMQDSGFKNKYRVNPNSLGKALGSQIGLIAGLNGTVGGKTGQPSNASYMSNKHSNQFRSQFESEQLLLTDKVDIKRLEEEWARDWRHLAEVLDRFFFWLFLSAIMVTTLLLFHPLTKLDLLDVSNDS